VLTLADVATLYERSEDLDHLLAPLTKPGAGSLTVVEGPAGIGKTRLLLEAGQRAREGGWSVLRACGFQLERDVSLGVVRQLFETFLHGLDPDERHACVSGPASVVDRLLRPAVADEDDTGSFAVLHGLTWLVLNIAATRPTMLQIDDLQWVDEASLRWLAYLVPRVEDTAVAVTVAVREQDRDGSDLAGRIACDSAATVVRPRPLRPTSVGRMLRGLLGQDVDPEFVLACHAETGGNPFLVKEIATWLQGERITPSTENVPQMRATGGQAVSRRVLARLTRESSDAVLLARALSVLGDGADLHQVIALSGLAYERAVTAVAALVRSDVFADRMPPAFVHPLVRTAVYGSVPSPERAGLHAGAAAVLTEAAAGPERIAAHVLLAPPGIDHAPQLLRGAAREAMRRGAVSTAVHYLARCRQEALGAGELVEVLVEEGSIGQLVDVAASSACLARAYDLVGDPLGRAETGWLLAGSLGHGMRIDEMVRVLHEIVAELDGLPDQPAEADDLRRRAYAMELLTSTLLPDRQGPLARLDHYRALAPADSLGGRILTAAVALRDAMACRPEAVAAAHRALGDRVPAGADVSSVSPAWHVLVIADAPTAGDILDRAIARLHDVGDLTALASAYAFRALSWVHRGHPAEGEADARQALGFLEAAGAGFARPFAGAFLAEALLDQGRLDAAREALDRTGIHDASSPGGPTYHVLCMRARLARLGGDAVAAAELALACGRVYSAHGADNPAIVPWRSELAQSLLARGERTTALVYAEAELELARRWGAPRALGRALRVSALAVDGTDPAERERRLREAVAVLDGTPARLELARAVADLGAVLLAADRRAEARDTLRTALELSTACGAALLVEWVLADLRAAGGRPRRDDPGGPGALTPSERRVAELATGGATNRAIAETLFVTPKTVELHLTNIYRKLGIGSRADIAAAMTG
jgi:DNA-binding CsgD family transcriptional regulator